MTDSSEITMIFDQLKAGHDSAAGRIWNAYFEAVVQEARKRMRYDTKRASDEEDVALSVMRNVIEGAKAGRFEKHQDRTDFWRLMIAITRQKVIDRRRGENRLKRGAGEIRGESVFINPGDDSSAAGLAQRAKDEVTPDFMLMLEEENQRLFASLRDEVLVQIAQLRFEGYANEEIAAKTQLSMRSVERKLALIRERMEKELAKTCESQ
jgi:DNA-directed RNA polymerase specialized sigma24 family protein